MYIVQYNTSEKFVKGWIQFQNNSNVLMFTPNQIAASKLGFEVLISVTEKNNN